ncbi:hypothetical protein EDE12_11252 [Methylosinus sp. sav-2]|uniref:SAM-dependent methyltransferase n=1 Tax=Methylosinus sp. sav-2 TaxID=2485168 RepID=UPI00047A2426|nr:SAM-dependent methyltransferase [Methylosinus sp. sav-2]TDX61951.1 hypothetical protein EDE12_11252 [Methylosinus sp. sav-2]
MTEASARTRKSHVWKRDALDWYVEETRASAALFEVERFVGAIWDPACGGGNICDEAARRGYIVVGSDIARRVENKVWWSRTGTRDFLTDASAPLAPNIVVNPPFFRGKGTEAFIRKALALARGKVAVFASIGFLAGDARASGLYTEHTPHRIWHVTPRVSCPPGEWLAEGNKAGGGTDDWVWLVWDLTAPCVSFAQTGWLRKSAAASKGRESAT